MSVELEKGRLLRRLIELKNSEGFFNDDPKVKEEVNQIRNDLKALDLAELTPEERAIRAIEERSAPTREELGGA